MVASIGQMASAEYYLESQRSFRHPNEYYTAGEEPDGTWFNPKGLFGLEDGVKVDAGHFQRLYNGFEPDGSDKLVQRAGNPDRSPGVDMTFSVDKSVSALWAISPSPGCASGSRPWRWPPLVRRWKTRSSSIAATPVSPRRVSRARWKRN